MRLEPDPRERYAREWRRFRRLRIAFWILAVAGIPFFLLVGALAHSLTSSILFLVESCLLYFAMLWVTGYNVSRFPCPRCGMTFARNRVFGVYPPTQRCDSCGLPLWAGPEAPVSQRGVFS